MLGNNMSSSSIYRGELSFLQRVHFCICSAILTGYLFRQWLACMHFLIGKMSWESALLEDVYRDISNVHSCRYTANRIWRVQRGGTAQANSYFLVCFSYSSKTVSRPGLFLLFNSLLLSNQKASFLFENRIEVVTSLQKSYCQIGIWCSDIKHHSSDICIIPQTFVRHAGVQVEVQAPTNTPHHKCMLQPQPTHNSGTMDVLIMRTL